MEKDAYLDFDHRDKFKNHVVTVLENTPNIQMFKCRDPETISYYFYITITDMAISIYGDMGCLTLVAGGIDWFRGSIRDGSYAMSKIPHNFETKEFDEKAAIKAVKEIYDDKEVTEDIKLACLDMLSDIEMGQINDKESFVDAWFRNDLHEFTDYEPEIMGYTAMVWHQMSAFIWLADQLDKMDFHKAVKEEAAVNG